MRERSAAVLMFHDIRPGAGADYAVSRANLDEALSTAVGPGSVPIEITFDDGWAGTFVHGLPLLLERRVVATLFVATGLVGQARYMDHSMLRAWYRSGQRVGSHAVTHRPLSLLPEREIRRELVESKACLEALLGAPVLELAVPGGNLDARVRALAFEVGYQRIYTSRPGFATPGQRLVPRFMVRAGTPAAAIQALRSGREHGFFAADRARWLVKQAIGTRLYLAVRARLRRR